MSERPLILLIAVWAIMVVTLIHAGGLDSDDQGCRSHHSDNPSQIGG